MGHLVQNSEVQKGYRMRSLFYYVPSTRLLYLEAAGTITFFCVIPEIFYRSRQN